MLTASARQSVKRWRTAGNGLLPGGGAAFRYARTATVSFEVGIAPLTGDSARRCLSTAWSISLSLFWFRSIGQAAGYRGQLPCAAENYRAGILSVAAIVWPAGSISTATEVIKTLRFLTVSLTAI